MSNTFSTPEITSPLVRSRCWSDSDNHHDSNVVSQLQQAEITPALSPQKSFPPSTIKAVEQVPQLSERDSIFATNYTNTDSSSNSPPPTLASKSNRDRNVEATFMLPDSISPKSSPHALPRRSKLSYTAITTSRFRDSGTSQAPDNLSVSFDVGDTERKLNDAEAPAGWSSLSSGVGPTKGRTMPAFPLRMPAAWNQQEEKSQKLSAGVDDRRNQLQGLSNREKAKRSSSRGHAEQQIEATLANEDSIPNSRSRKASHYLGLFKENTSAQDPRKGREPVEDDEEAKMLALHNNTSLASFMDIESLPSHTRVFSVPETPFSPVLESDQAEKSIAYTEQYRRPPGSRTISTRSTSQNYIIAEGSKSKQSIEWRSGNPAQGTLPLRLLEDIRNHNKTDLGEQDEEKTIQSTGPPFEGLENCNGLSGTPVDKFGGPPTELIKSGSRDYDDEEDDEYESDKEHISSATYYPHQGPSPEDSEEGQPDEAYVVPPKSEEQNEGLLPPQTLTLEVGEKDILSEPQQSAIALQSEAIVHAIPGDHQGNPSSSDNELVHKSTSSVSSSLSDTDYESWDETIRSEKGVDAVASLRKGDVTPTATPKAGESFLRSHWSRAPLGAVELKPYKHQVGGHTKVFSFSKQAICKQLNNRENEFYEVIERRHPELLRFLPRYLGVLNVTYQKAPRRKKKKAIKRALPSSGSPNGTGVIQAFDNSTVTQRADAHPGRGSHNGYESAEPVPRSISHSQYFETAEDTVPRVIYANNLHIIPDNLFQSPRNSLLYQRPQTSSGILGVDDNRNGTERERDKPSFISSRNLSIERRQRPSLSQSPSWGATTVNTKFKEKVLREVFSPPLVHHHSSHQHGRFRREGSRLRHMRGHGLLQPLPPDEEEDVKKLSDPATADGVSADTVSEERGNPKVGSAPSTRLTEASLAALEQTHSALDDPSRAASSDMRTIRRRRSAGGLRRHQIDLDNTQRSSFKYYEEDGYGGDKEDNIFSLELPMSRSSSIVSSMAREGASEHNKGSERLTNNYGQRDDAHVAALVPKAGKSPPAKFSNPLNPLEAQQQPDERVRHFLLLEDLTANMSNPCVLDLKMGTRQYGIEATKKKQMSQRQKCKNTTSQQLGVRVCGMQVWNTRTEKYLFEDKYAGRDIKAGREFQNALTRFLYDGNSYSSVTRHIPALLEKLSKLEKMIVKLPGYRFYASSLLMLYDGASTQAISDTDTQGIGSPTTKSGDKTAKAMKDKSESLHHSDIDIKLVDFANCVTGENALPETTPCPPKDPDGVDRGYILGLCTLRTYLQRIWKEIDEGGWVERGEGEGMGLAMKGAGPGMDQPDSWQESWMDDAGEVSV